ncbi:MAG: hypothetical protein ACRCXC_00055 [Legionella sp.]
MKEINLNLTDSGDDRRARDDIKTVISSAELGLGVDPSFLEEMSCGVDGYLNASEFTDDESQSDKRYIVTSEVSMVKDGEPTHKRSTRKRDRIDYSVFQDDEESDMESKKDI